MSDSRANYDFTRFEKTEQGSVMFFLKVTLFVSVFVAGALSMRLLEEKGIVSSPQKVAGVSTVAEQTDVAAKISNLILITTEEKPSVASIVDSEKLRASNPGFYANAQNGDKLVIYSDRAIIFREQDNLIINIVPITRDTDPANNTPLSPVK
jgi:hypothetical protein